MNGDNSKRMDMKWARRIITCHVNVISRMMNVTNGNNLKRIDIMYDHIEVFCYRSSHHAKTMNASSEEYDSYHSCLSSDTMET